jgi:hypothetical protein
MKAAASTAKHDLNFPSTADVMVLTTIAQIMRHLPWALAAKAVR